MSKSELQIRELIQAELAKVADYSRRIALSDLLVPPETLLLEWGYWPPNTRYECWLIARSHNGSRLLYCDEGFGPSYPWGIVGVDEDWMGMDCQWHVSLEDAAINAGSLSAPPDYEIP